MFSSVPAFANFRACRTGLHILAPMTLQTGSIPTSVQSGKNQDMPHLRSGTSSLRSPRRKCNCRLPVIISYLSGASDSFRFDICHYTAFHRILQYDAQTLYQLICISRIKSALRTRRTTCLHVAKTVILQYNICRPNLRRNHV